MFVGAERRRLVAALETLFGEVGEAGQPRLVSLEAPLGWGKTRIVQELYGRLAAGQGYWPPALTPSDERDPLKTRKRVHPGDFLVAAGGELPWMWWGISCERRQAGVAAQVLADDMTQLFAHQAGIVARTSRNKAIKRAFKSVASFTVSLALPDVGDLIGGVSAAGTLSALRASNGELPLMDRAMTVSSRLRTASDRRSLGSSLAFYARWGALGCHASW